MSSLYLNTTLVFLSMGGWELPAWSPCMSLVNFDLQKVIFCNNSVPVAVGRERDALLWRGPVLVDVVDAEVVVRGEDDDVAVEGGAGVELHLLHHEARLAQEEALRDGERPGKGER